eukprot:scaffold10024_cov30-Prasinocladus_malaysianus.AAC.1
MARPVKHENALAAKALGCHLVQGVLRSSACHVAALGLSGCSGGLRLCSYSCIRMNWLELATKLQASTPVFHKSRDTYLLSIECSLCLSWCRCGGKRLSL